MTTSSSCKLSVLLMLLLPIHIHAQSWKAEESAVDSTRASMTDLDHSLGEAVVTAQYTPGSVQKAVHQIRVIDRKKIDNMNAQNLKDALSNELNIRLSQDNILGSGMSIQGISGQNVKILIDGVPVVGRLEGNIDLSQINLNNIERIEIIEGPMSVNYGTDALAGTINLITKKNQSRHFEGSLTSYYESVGTYNFNGRLGLQHKRHLVSVNGGRHFFDGWHPGDRSFDWNFGERPADSLRFKQWKPKEQYFGDFQYGYTSKKSLSLNYRGSYFHELITNRGLPRLPYGEYASDDRYHTYRLDNAVFLTSNVGENRKLNIQSSFNQYKRVRNTYAKDLTNLDEVLSVSPGDQDTSKFHQFNSRGTLATSYLSRKINYELGYDVNLEFAQGARINNRKQKINDYALFASAEYKPVPYLTIRPGLRYAYNTGYRAPVIPSLHIRIEPLKNLTVRASYGRGFRAPTLKELYFEFVDINHNIQGAEQLKPEYSSNYNGSVSYILRRTDIIYKLEGSAFYNNINNQITLAETGPDAEYSYINIGINKTVGFQANVEVIVENFKLAVGSGWIGRYNQVSVEAPQMANFSYSPELRANLSYRIAPLDITAVAFYKYTGRLPGFTVDADGNINHTDIDPYHIADVSIARSFAQKSVNLAIGCKNLFDIQNINRMAAGGSGGVHSSGGSSVPIGMGRTYFLRLVLQLKSMQ